MKSSHFPLGWDRAPKDKILPASEVEFQTLLERTQLSLTEWQKSCMVYCTSRTYWKSTLWNVPEICHLGARKSCSGGVSPEALCYKAPRGVPGEAASHWMLPIAVHCRGQVLERAPVLWSSCPYCRRGALGRLQVPQEPEDRTPDGGRKSPSSCTVSPAPSTDRA